MLSLPEMTTGQFWTVKISAGDVVETVSVLVAATVHLQENSACSKFWRTLLGKL